MSFKATGKLYIKSRTGKYGEFNVGKLYTETGDFDVRDEAFDQLEEGAYFGTFIIGRVFLKNINLASGGALVQLHARVEDYSLHGEGDIPPDVAVGAEEQDPIVEEQTASTAANADVVEAEQPKASSAPKQSDVEVLFGLEEGQELGSLVKLDVAVGRAKFRQQRDYLRANGYTYDPGSQTWEKKLH